MTNERIIIDNSYHGDFFEVVQQNTIDRSKGTASTGFFRFRRWAAADA